MSEQKFIKEQEAAKLIGWSYSNLRNRRLMKVALEAELELGAKSTYAPDFIVRHGAKGGAKVWYRHKAVLAWMRRHPEIVTKADVIGETLSQCEVAEMLGVSKATLRKRRRKVADGEGQEHAPPHVMAHTQIRYREKDVRAWAKRYNWPLVG